MHVNRIPGRIDRVFYFGNNSTLYLKLEGSEAVMELRVDTDRDDYFIPVMLAKPGDDVVVWERNGHLDKFENITMKAGT